MGESGDAVGQLGMLTGDARLGEEGLSTGVRDCPARQMPSVSSRGMCHHFVNTHTALVPHTTQQ